MENKTCNRTNQSTLSEMDVDSPQPSNTELNQIVEEQEEVKGHAAIPHQSPAVDSSDSQNNSEKENSEHVSPVTACSRPCEKKKLKFALDPIICNSSSRVGAHVQWSNCQISGSPPPLTPLYSGEQAGEKY